MNPRDLPVYQHREKILAALKQHPVIVVESPTGSGKTTQLPIILHEAGYDQTGMIGVTQPRRIAAVSVSSYIQQQLLATEPGIVGYKMRFDDRTSRSTRIKIMTDGILLQEMKLDPLLSHYNVLMVDEAHERSLNIDFVLGLLKRVLEQRPNFKVIVSSATLNTQVFSEYFNDCPIVRIETDTYPVGITYKPAKTGNEEELIQNISGIVDHIMDEKREGDILIFLPGEKLIKECMTTLAGGNSRRKLHIIPLYGRLAKEEQDLVFVPPPKGKTKVVIATNIAETSITIDGITSVIDSGLAKLNFYNPKTYTSSLVERPISRASANQRKGRAGRTRPGTCYRLYSKEDFESRPLFTQEEIYRTDLSEVVLRMAELGIRDFDSFDFISSPGKQGIAGAVEILMLLEALEADHSLSKIGTMMAQFPLLPRHSRIIVEAILKYPTVVEEVLIATSFLSCDAPFLLPQGEELEARRAHHQYRDPAGDFMSYLKLYKAWNNAENKVKFCQKAYLDDQAMAEIGNVKEQLAQIVSSIGVPISSGGPLSHYLCCIGKGLIQFICIRDGRQGYRSLTAERIEIHPSSVMYKETPKFIVAGEVVKTSRMYARSIGELRREWLADISPELARRLLNPQHQGGEVPAWAASAETAKGERAPGKNRRAETQAEPAVRRSAPESAFTVTLGGIMMPLAPYKGKKKVLSLDEAALDHLLNTYKPSHQRPGDGLIEQHANLRAVIQLNRGQARGKLFEGERLARVLNITSVLVGVHPGEPGLATLEPGMGIQMGKLSIFDDPQKIRPALTVMLRVCPARKGLLGFMTLYSNKDGMFWLKPTLAFSTALSECLASLEMMADQLDEATNPELFHEVGGWYRKLSEMLERS